MVQYQLQDTQVATTIDYTLVMNKIYTGSVNNNIIKFYFVIIKLLLDLSIA